MKPFALFWLVMGMVAGMVLILMSGCAGGNKATVVLGPKPTDSGQSDYVVHAIDGLRAWIGTLSPGDAKQLQDSGRLAYAYPQLQSTDPVHARLIADFVENSRAATVKLIQATGHAPKPDLATPHDPDQVEFKKMAPGAYHVIITSATGMKYMELAISTASH